MNWSVFGKAFLVETVYSIPFFILSILPFKKQLRFPIKILILFIFIGQLLQSSLYTYLISHGKPTRVTDTVFAFVSLAIYFLCVKANFWKLLFLGNFILNYFVTVRGICFFLESLRRFERLILRCSAVSPPSNKRIPHIRLPAYLQRL